jgi:hypothetical protein
MQMYSDLYKSCLGGLIAFSGNVQREHNSGMVDNAMPC